ncbi:uncharacterized protein LOC143376941 [Andrena cerasifolii]|uniref:uncharacterized protein LOC143376941 n=1 Tax=Andrena cerasifolii TaxID=2819439 RepID=UPI004037D81E
MEYTLEDAFAALQDTQRERQQELDDLVAVILNSGPVAVSRSVTPEETQSKQQRMRQCLLNQVLKEVPRDYPVPETSDLHVEALRELEEEVRNAQQLFEKTKAHLEDINEDISYLEKKKMGLEKMKEACTGAAELVANTTYAKEHLIAKKMFQDVKEDLFIVVDTLFPENQDFKDFLASLTSAYRKGGNDLYVDVTPNVFDFVNFLVEADIAVLHRNDKSKVRLMDML